MWWCPVILQGVSLNVGCFEEHTAAFSMSIGSCPDLFIELEWLSDDALLYYRVSHWKLDVSTHTAVFSMSRLLSRLVSRAGMVNWWFPVILQGVPLKVGCYEEHTAAFSMSIRFSPYRVLFCFPPCPSGHFKQEQLFGELFWWTLVEFFW